MFKFLKPYLRPYRSDVIWALVTITVSMAATLWQPKLLQGVIAAIAENQMEKVGPLGVQLVIVALIGLVAAGLNTYFAAKVSTGVAADVRHDTYQTMQNFSMGNVEKFSAGSLVVRLTNDVQQVQTMLMGFFQSLLKVPIMFIGAFVMAMLTLPQLWWVIVGMVIIVVVMTYLLFKPMGGMFGQIQKLVDRTNNLAKENLQGVRVVKSFNQGAREAEQYKTAADELADVNIKIGYLFFAMLTIFTLVGQIGIATALWYVADNLKSDPAMLSGVSAFVNYLMQVMMAIIIGGFMMTFSARGMVSVKRIKEVQTTDPMVVYPETDQAEQLGGSITFDHVDFAYPNDEELVLKDVSFHINAGETVGLVGATGSGKSTLAQLIPRLYDPSAGQIKVGEVDLHDVSEPTLRRSVAMVLQKAILFSGSIADNLRQGKPNASLAEMQKAADISQAAEFVGRYDDTFEHEIAERSANLSGGQKQRLSIARGVIGQPSILILDDSTSALDAKSEKSVQIALDTDLKAVTKLIIAEKISSVIKADRILVMDDGRLVGSGTHRELLETSPVYQEIYATQKPKEVQ